MNNSRLFRLSRIVIALTAASGMMVNTANAKEEAKAATQYTQQVNQNYAKSLPFSDRQDFDDAQRGFIAPLLDEGILRDANGKVYYRADDYKFDINAAAPETVNPSLWRQSQINGISGLFKVTDKMYQVRGQDISNITFVEGEKGIIVIDPLVTPPAAKAALDLYFQHRPQKPIVAVIYTHSHTDHYGGVKGIISEVDVKSGKVQVIAPAGFMDEAISENVLAGNIMSRRALYSYGLLLPHNRFLQVMAFHDFAPELHRVVIVNTSSEQTSTQRPHVMQSRLVTCTGLCSSSTGARSTCGSGQT